MPNIFDNIELQFLPTLQKAMEVSQRADFCVGYFNLRGWRHIDHYVEKWAGGDGKCCRLLVGMHRPSEEHLLRDSAVPGASNDLDRGTAQRLRKKLAEEFRTQLTLGAPTAPSEMKNAALAEFPSKAGRGRHVSDPASPAKGTLSG